MRRKRNNKRRPGGRPRTNWKSKEFEEILKNLRKGKEVRMLACLRETYSLQALHMARPRTLLVLAESSPKLSTAKYFFIYNQRPAPALIKNQPEPFRRTEEDWLGNALEKAEEQSRRKGMGKAISLKALTPKQESEELLLALNTIDSKDNEMVDVQMNLNTETSRKYIVSQKLREPVPTYEVPYERNIASRQSEKTEFRDTSQKRKTFSVLSNAAQLNMNDEFKRQLEYLRTPSDTFYNGRTTQQSFKSINSFSNQNTKQQFFSESKIHPALAAEEERLTQNYLKKQPTSYKTLLPAAQSRIDYHPSENDLLDSKYNRYLSMNELDTTDRRMDALMQYKERYSRRQEENKWNNDHEIVQEMTPKDVNLEVVIY